MSTTTEENMSATTEENAAELLAEKLRTGTATVGVVGLGYVGLPLLHAFISVGFKTMGFDVDANKIETLERGSSYIKHIPSEWIASWLADGLFSDGMFIGAPYGSGTVAGRTAFLPLPAR